jgi:hypothetical protein
LIQRLNHSAAWSFSRLVIQQPAHSAAWSFSRLVIQPLPLLSFRSAAEESVLIAATNADLSASLRDDKQVGYEMTNNRATR